MARRMTELAFVMSPLQNWFFHELVAALQEELERQNIPSSLSTEGFPEPRHDRVYVVVPPHEYVALEGKDALPPDQLLGRTIFVCAEQPGTGHFDADVELARRAGATFDINRWSVELLRRAGVAARHLQLGYTPRWDHFDPDRERDIDVAFLGCHSPRRLHHLNSYARVLSRWNCHVQLSDNSRPNTGNSPSFLADQKWDLLARSKVLINLHQGDEPYFEWLRAIDALHCGAVVVTEHSTDPAPFEPGRHLYVGHPESLALIADGLLRDESRLDRMRRDGHDQLRSGLPLAASAAELAGVARALVARPLPKDRGLPRPGASPPGASPPVADPFTPQNDGRGTELAMLHAATKDTRLDLLDLRRQLTRLTRAIRSPGHEDPATVRRVYETAAWRGSRGEAVTVLTALYNHRDLIAPTLDSLERSHYRSFEIVVVDDGSGDGSGDAAVAWMRSHENVPALLVRHPVNRGLGAARNTALDFARGRYCLVLDSDNEIYPRCLDALVGTLERDPEPVFAYPILETFGMVEAYATRGGDPLVSFLGWEPRRLRMGNFIDALALIRTRELREVGAYTTDGRLYGWEDYDLWCRIAERGGSGRLVPQPLARYRTSPSSMLSITNLSLTSAKAAVIERYPRLMEGVTASF
jgi:Glycosyl transferase family 2